MLTVEVAYKGSAADKELARAIFQVLSIQGRFMSFDAPIRMQVPVLIDVLGQIGTTATESEIATAVKKNDAIFSSEKDEDGVLSVLTTRGGHAPASVANDVSHSFVERFMKPLPKPEKPAYVPREKTPTEPVWAPIDTTSAVEETVLAAEAALNAPAAEALEIDVIEETVEEEVAPAARTITVQPQSITQLDEIDDLAVAEAITERLTMDPRVATFGDQWMLEDRVARFGRNDMRRIRDYIQEQEQPLADDVIAQDVLGGRPGTPDFDSLRFAVNFRLSKEHRDFDFVGTANQRFWSVSTLAQLGTSRKKPNEIGTDYRHLNDEVSETPAYRSRQTVDRVLTFYEYQLGLLPYDQEMAELLPAPLLPNQRTAVLTFECPQSYTTYLVELRYPSPNRGGFIVGLDDFYNENLVPGALISLSRTDNDGHYIVKYVPAETQNAKLLELEDRRQRYVFRPGTFACGVIDEQVLTEERFPALNQEKPMDDKARRRIETVVSVAFERVARPLESGTGFAATFNELFAVANIERPLTEAQLRTTLDTDESGAFSRDPDVDDGYTYVPSSN
jgi:hypothetical protein